MISISNISYFIGGRALYEDASAVIKQGDRIGLIGLNGKGKSTLLKIIEGSITPDKGSVSKSKDCTIGFLNQDLLSFQSEEPILTVAMGAFKEALETHRALEKVIHEMETGYHDALVERMSALQEKFERLDGYSMQARAEEVLEGIGFQTADLHRPLKTFSGGWRMRVMLAKLLLEKPSLLMLDEPTNHLDLPSIEWIEEYLRTYDGAVIVVSHDRTFLNNVTNRTIEVARQQLITYEGNYDHYLDEKELREEIQQNAFENQQQKIRQAERFIDRFRAKATKARQVQSRIKMIERMDKVEEVVDDTAEVNFRFTMKQQSGRHIMELKHISKSYGDLQILKNTSAQIERGDKIALIGANGKGKSTMLRILYGSEQVEGERKPGYNVITGFYAQHQLEALQVENEVLEELKQAGSGKTELELRNLLGCFLFSDDDVFKKIKVLSGGEKSRVALAKTLISEANFLLLDEPTNHLDFISENILVQALEQYQGSFVIVSHNRHFIRQVANKIWWIEDGEIRQYPGSYDEFIYWKQSKTSAEIPVVRSPEIRQAEPQKKPAEQTPPGNEKLKKDLEKKIRLTEEKIGQLEQQLKESESELAKPEVYADHEKFQVLNANYSKILTDLDIQNKEWEGLVERLSSL